MSEVDHGQPTGLTPLDEPADAELISAVRGGDLDAYGTLFARHVDSARRLARQLASPGDVDDLVSDAFAKVLAVLQKGGGPDLAFRAYLLTSLRRLHVDRLRAGARLTTTDDLSPYDPGVAFEDTAVSGFDNAAAAKAFASLPERWQQVLWHTEVEGQKPAEIAPLLGISANSVSALAYRAREGLRQAFISMHAQDATEDACAATRANLGAYVRGGISKRDGAKVEDHLSSCRECSAIYLELTEINNDLGAVLAPMLLGTAGAGYLAAAHLGAIGAAKGGLMLLLGRGRDWVLHNPAGRATAGATGAVAAAAVVAAAALAHGGNSSPQADRPAPTPAASSPATPPAAPASAPAPTQRRDTPATPATIPAPPVPPVAPSTPSSPAQVSAPTRPTSTAPEIQEPLAPITAASAASPVTIDLTRGAKDPDGDPITVRSARVVAPSHGSVVIDREHARTATPALAGRTLTEVVTSARVARRVAGPTTVTYTSEPGWRGTDTIHYVLTDGHGGTVSGAVEVRTPDAAPVAADDTAQATVTWAAALPVTINVLGNDTDANRDALTITAVTQPEHGEAAVDGNTIRYTPPVGLGEQSDSFDYTISDGHGRTATATVTVQLGALPDRAPSADSFDQDVAYGMPATMSLSAHASDPDHDALRYAVASGPDHGTVTIDAVGNATYTPTSGYTGADSFGYTVDDGRGGTATGTVHLTVAPPPNAAPKADSFDVTATSGVSTTITLSAHASDADGDQLTYAVASGPDHGTVTTDAAGNATYFPAHGYTGTDSFSYTVDDGEGGTATGTVRVTVQAESSDLALKAMTNPVTGYEHIRLSAAGIPTGADHTATFTLHISGITGWELGQTHSLGHEVSGCSLPSAPSGTLDLTCTVSGNSEIIHLDFDFADSWSVHASLAPDDFVDSQAGDTTFERAAGDGHELGE